MYRPGAKRKPSKFDVQTCRICLTQDSKQNNMDLSLPLRDIEDSPLIFEALEEVMGEKVLKFESFSSSICAMCLGLLKIAYDLKEQYYKSKKSFKISESLPGHIVYKTERPLLSESPAIVYSKVNINKLVNTAVQTEKTSDFKEEDIKKMFSKNTKIVYSKMKINKLVNVAVQTEHTDFKTAELTKDAPNVELVTGENSYDIKDLVIVENPPDEENNDVFQGFLQNLGSVVSASYAGAQKPTKCSEDRAELEITPLTQDDFDVDALEPLEISNPSKMSYTCPHCKKTYDSADYVKRHMPICEKFHKRQCYICEESKHSLNDLIFHIRHKHSVAQNLEHPLIDKYVKGLTCKECGKVAVSRGGLMYHMRQHKGKQYACEECGKTFLFEYKLKCHQKSHDKSATVEVCPVCAKTFHYRGAVQSHMKWHNQEYTYQCSYCEKKFIYLNSKTTHERTHTGEKPYECRYCGRCFARYSERQTHERGIHTGERPYKCQYCMVAFVTTFNLKVHMLQHEGPFECHICNKGFVQSDILKYHLKRNHQITEEIVDEDMEQEVDYFVEDVAQESEHLDQEEDTKQAIQEIDTPQSEDNGNKNCFSEY